MYWNTSLLLGTSILPLININMRCIEILGADYVCTNTGRLTLTWDVLKLINKISAFSVVDRLTLTWDVLK